MSRSTSAPLAQPSDARTPKIRPSVALVPLPAVARPPGESQSHNFIEIPIRTAAGRGPVVGEAGATRLDDGPSSRNRGTSRAQSRTRTVVLYVPVCVFWIQVTLQRNVVEFMLSTMATVTSGILSPNSYGLNTDAVSLKLAHPEPMDTYHHRHPFSHPSTYPEQQNSSDSEQEVPYASNSPKSISEPKRNKRKNFKPRCSQNIPSEDEGVLNLSDYHENNNVNNNARRRKPIGGTRKVIVDPSFTPMDLSGSKNDSEASERLSHDSELLSQYSMKPESDNSDSDDFNTDNFRAPSDNDEGKDDSDVNSDENDSSKIPSSFSIHNLSKPHVTDQGALLAQNLSPDQISEMRNYAMNTMRELLSIYGLTSEVAESISRQLPLAAFTTDAHVCVHSCAVSTELGEFEREEINMDIFWSSHDPNEEAHDGHHFSPSYESNAFFFNCM
ncbi:hypothetical protein GWI33_020597 [Rhynchophorus ferrugineus]|uniref:Uncharacterized protein n=1 Tax=Rhynchophorus ferrugineus TaxID=354439 RepID=A0A834I312_RHYFE|nr:hypothetical protein GWI33_020597 [Rhynchophorus ferrugineus]